MYSKIIQNGYTNIGDQNTIIFTELYNTMLHICDTIKSYNQHSKVSNWSNIISGEKNNYVSLITEVGIFFMYLVASKSR